MDPWLVLTPLSTDPHHGHLNILQRPSNIMLNHQRRILQWFFQPMLLQSQLTRRFSIFRIQTYQLEATSQPVYFVWKLNEWFISWSDNRYMTEMFDPSLNSSPLFQWLNWTLVICFMNLDWIGGFLDSTWFGLASPCLGLDLTLEFVFSNSI